MSADVKTSVDVEVEKLVKLRRQQLGDSYGLADYELLLIRGAISDPEGMMCKMCTGVDKQFTVETRWRGRGEVGVTEIAVLGAGDGIDPHEDRLIEVQPDQSQEYYLDALKQAGFEVVGTEPFVTVRRIASHR